MSSNRLEYEIFICETARPRIPARLGPTEVFLAHRLAADGSQIMELSRGASGPHASVSARGGGASTVRAGSTDQARVID
jgi:hypothetical protein